MDFTEVIRTRRSVRSFSDRAVPNDVLRRVLEGARVAPSGNNRQPWRYIAVRDETHRRAIAAAAYDQMFIASAPVVFVCCAERYGNTYEPHGDLAGLVDAIIGIDHLTLAARNEGLGTCWVGAFHPEPIRRVLAVPKGVEIEMLVPMGYPASPSALREVASRLPLDEIAFSETFGEVLGS